MSYAGHVLNRIWSYLSLIPASPIYFALCSGSRGVSDVSVTHVDLYFVPCDTICDLFRLHFKTNIARYSQGRGITSRFDCLGQLKNTSLSELFFLRTRMAVLQWIFFLVATTFRLLCFFYFALLNSRWMLGKYGFSSLTEFSIIRDVCLRNTFPYREVPCSFVSVALSICWIPKFSP